MSARVALDASAAVRLLMGMDDDSRIADVLREAAVVVAPMLYVAEVANALRGYVDAGALDRDTAIERHEEALHLVDDLVPDRELGLEALCESIRNRHPAYDLVYAVLARRTGAGLLTRDGELIALLPQLGVESAL